jgi:hypothetical protein
MSLDTRRRRPRRGPWEAAAVVPVPVGEDGLAPAVDVVGSGGPAAGRDRARAVDGDRVQEPLASRELKFEAFATVVPKKLRLSAAAAAKL